MRIIKEGRKPKYEWTTTCKRCGCIFAYDKNDKQTDNYYSEHIVCPTCGEIISFGTGARSVKEY